MTLQWSIVHRYEVVNPSNEHVYLCLPSMKPRFKQFLHHKALLDFKVLKYYKTTMASMSHALYTVSGGENIYNWN